MDRAAKAGRNSLIAREKVQATCDAERVRAANTTKPTARAKLYRDIRVRLDEVDRGFDY